MRKNIQSIDTLYRGVYYRSRLEARWAVFFDALDVKFNYEIVGMSFGNVRYLPDFQLPDIMGGVHVEIKPQAITKEEQNRLDEIMATTRDADMRLWVIAGYPAQGEYSIEVNTHDGPAEFATCRRCGRLALLAQDWYHLTCGPGCGCDRWPMTDTGTLRMAHEYATRYKFDHLDASSKQPTGRWERR